MLSDMKNYLPAPMRVMDRRHFKKIQVYPHNCNKLHKTNVLSANITSLFTDLPIHRSTVPLI